MKRRSFFQVLTAVAAACFLPPIRAAQELRSRIRHLPRWLDGRKRWEHLPVPIPSPQSYVVHGPSDAKIVCRVLGPTHFNTNLDPRFGGFEAALDEAGWAPEEIERRVHHNYGNWGVSVPCESCTRRIWVSVETARAFEPTFAASGNYFGWQLARPEGVWQARCPDHQAQG